MFFTPDYFHADISNLMHEGEDPPIAFGQHANAEINSQITETNELLDAVVALQPLKVSADGSSVE